MTAESGIAGLRLGVGAPREWRLGSWCPCAGGGGGTEWFGVNIMNTIEDGGIGFGGYDLCANSLIKKVTKELCVNYSDG